MDPSEYLDGAAAAVRAIVEAVRDDQLHWPTTCPDWDVRTVINHIALGGARVTAWVREQPAPPWETDYLSADFQEDVRQTVAGVRAALAEPGALDREVPTAFGRATGATLIGMLANEYLAHGWDVADATGQNTDFAPRAAERALAEAHVRFAGLSREPGGPFGPPVDRPDHAAPADRLAAFLGRSGVRNRVSQ